MKLLRIAAQTILIIIMISFALSSGRDAYATDVEVIRGHLFVDRAPFIIKGINYNPIPIGVDPETTPPYGNYFTSNYSPIYERDLPLLREMGANTVRVWGYNNGADQTDFLNKTYNNGVKPIYVIMAFPLNPTIYPDISSPNARRKIKADFRAMVADYKNHPALLMWAIGDGLNARNGYGEKLRDLFTLINEMAKEARAEEGVKFHPVTISLADLDLIDTVSTFEPLMPDVDIWGVSINRGDSFGTLFRDFKKVSAKPLLIMGFGIDAYDERAGDEYENIGEPYQATYAESLWKEIEINSDVCMGGLIRSYSDEWWLGKYGNTLEGCPDDDPLVHSPCGHPSSSDPDGFVNYEWFGVMRVVPPTLEKGGKG